MIAKTIVLALAAGVAIAGAADARERIRIVGSSTVFPYTQAVAEEFANRTGMAAPVVESTGTGGGFKLFCAGVGTDHPDIAGASRAIKPSEFATCQENGVASITEVLIGYDGLSMAVSREGAAVDLTKAQLWQALAAETVQSGKIVANPYTRWSEIDPALPDVRIQVFGPPPTSGTRDAWVELVMQEGCAGFPAVAALPDERKDAVCSRMRQDGLYVEAGENDNLIVQRLKADPTAYGIFGYSFLYENADTLQPVTVAGVAPTFETIADGSYAVSRPLYVYVKNAHRGVIPGLDAFLEEYVSEAAMGPGGYLGDRGLVPLPDAEREDVQRGALSATALTM